ncbi:hypothetical protein ACQ4PT_059389 [Festuca glaucescens]
MVSSELRVPPAPKRHCCRHVSSAAAAVSLSQDVILEILSWLPAKSLCRSLCVSKEWRAFISSPSFTAVHKSRAEPLLIAMSDSIRGRRTLQLMDTEGTVVRVVEGPDGVWTFRASLGDLVCFSSGYNSSGTLVVDLATGKTILYCSESVAGVPMQYTCFGLGRAVQSGSLKVFRLVLPRSGVEQICEVLTLGDGAKWRQTRSPPVTVSLWYSRCYGVMANGALQLLSWEDRDDVLSFDLDNEKWKVIHGPQGVVGDMEPIRITELNGTLCMAHIVEPVINIWLLSDLDKSMDQSVHDAEGSGLPLCGAFESVTTRWAADILLL